MNLLDLPEVRSQLQPISVETYHEMVGKGELDRVELLQGFLVRKMSKSPLHRYIVRTLHALLQIYCPGRDLLLFKEDPLTLSDSEPEPDLAVVAGREEDYTSSHPTTAELVVEVSIASVATDRAKAEIYAGANIEEYWLVLPEKGEIVVYRQPVAGHYTSESSHRESEPVQSSVLEGFEVRLRDLLPET